MIRRRPCPPRAPLPQAARRPHDLISRLPLFPATRQRRLALTMSMMRERNTMQLSIGRYSLASALLITMLVGGLAPGIAIPSATSARTVAAEPTSIARPTATATPGAGERPDGCERNE